MNGFPIKILILGVFACVALFFAFQMAQDQQKLIKQNQQTIVVEPPSAAPKTSLEEENEVLKSRVAELEKKLHEQQQAWTRFSEDLKVAESAKESTPKPGTEPKKEEPTPEQLSSAELIKRFNQLLDLDGVHDWRLFECESAKEGIAQNVILNRVGPTGAVTGAVVAEEMRFQLPDVAGMIWLILRKGHEIDGGQKRPFENDFYRAEIGPVNLKRWQEQLPEFFVGAYRIKKADPAPVQKGANKPGRPNNDRYVQKLNQLFESKSVKYRFREIGAVGSTELKDVEIIRQNSSGGEDQILRAPVAKIRFDPEGKSTELILEKGTQEKSKQLTPLPASGYRILFSEIQPIEWKSVFGEIGR